MYARCTCVVVLFAATAAADDAKPKATVADLAWLTGSWNGKQGNTETEENWTTPKGGMLLGTNRTIAGKGRTDFEFLRIADTKNGVSYFASPMGQPATEFPMKSLEKEKVTFENLKHDFPQRIIYKKVDGKLHVRIEGTVGGKERSNDWVWEK